MKLVTWNCAGRLARTAQYFFALDPDIAILEECLQSTINCLATPGYNCIWFGDEKKKGIALYSKHEWTVTPISAPTHRWIVPLQVRGPEEFTLIAVWSCPAKTSLMHYVRHVGAALQSLEHLFGQGSVVIAGDFNSSQQTESPSSREHRAIVARLEEKGLISAYHHASENLHGKESDATYHHQWNAERPFHIDYIFVPSSWTLRNFSLAVGSHQEWSTHSDHRPLTLNLPPASLPLIV